MQKTAESKKEYKEGEKDDDWKGGLYEIKELMIYKRNIRNV